MKPGDRVRLIEEDKWSQDEGLILGDIYTVSAIYREIIEVGSKYAYHIEQFELVTKSQNFITLYEKLSN